MLVKFLFLLTLFLVDSQELNAINNNNERKFHFTKHRSHTSFYKLSGEAAHIFDGLGALSGGGATSRFCVLFNFFV